VVHIESSDHRSVTRSKEGGGVDHNSRVEIRQALHTVILVLDRECGSVDPQQEGSLYPIDELRSAAHVDADLGKDLKGKHQLSGGCGFDGRVGPLVFVQVIADIEATGHLREAAHDVHASVDAINILGSIDVASRIAVIGIYHGAISDRRTTSVAIGGIGDITAILRARAGARTDIDRSTIGVVGSGHILEHESEVSKVDRSTDQIFEGIVSQLATKITAGHWEGLSTLLRVQTRTGRPQESSISVDQVDGEVPAESIEISFSGKVLEPLIG